MRRGTCCKMVKVHRGALRGRRPLVDGGPDPGAGGEDSHDRVERASPAEALLDRTNEPTVLRRPDHPRTPGPWGHGGPGLLRARRRRAGIPDPGGGPAAPVGRPRRRHPGRRDLPRLGGDQAHAPLRRAGLRHGSCARGHPQGGVRPSAEAPSHGLPRGSRQGDRGAAPRRSPSAMSSRRARCIGWSAASTRTTPLPSATPCALWDRRSPPCRVAVPKV